MLKRIPQAVDAVSEVIARKTKPFVDSIFGKFFLALVLAGPFTFIPTLIEAWTAPNIDALRTLTWPLMILVNFAGGLALIHNGDWRMRLVTLVWLIVMGAVCVALLVR